jgi:hypothetical protein
MGKFSESIEKTLIDAGTPLTPVEITIRMASAGTWTPPKGGATPENTVAAHLYRSVNKGGPSNLFVKVSPGVFGLKGRDVSAAAPAVALGSVVAYPVGHPLAEPPIVTGHTRFHVRARAAELGLPTPTWAAIKTPRVKGSKAKLSPKGSPIASGGGKKTSPPAPVPTPSTYLEVELLPGSPSGPIIVRNPAGIVIVASVSRKNLHDPKVKLALQRLLDAPGAYLLEGWPDGELKPWLYAGESDQVNKRLETHLNSKLWWVRALVFLGLPDGLTKAHVQELEFRLLKLLKSPTQIVYHVDNGANPKPAVLSPAQKNYVDAFLHHALEVCPLLGVHAFET